MITKEAVEKNVAGLTKQAKEIFNNKIEGMTELFFPSQTYADYNFDETTGKYTVDFTKG